MSDILPNAADQTPTDTPKATAKPRRRKSMFDRLRHALSLPTPKLVGFGVILICLIFLSAGVEIWQLYQRTISDAERSIATLNVVLSEQTSRTLQGVDLVMQGVADIARSRGIDTPEAFSGELASTEIFGLLRDRARAAPQIDSILLVGADGAIINGSRAFPSSTIGANARTELMTLRDRAGPGVAIGKPIPNPMTGGWVFYAARRIESANGRMIGLIVGVLDVGKLEEFYRAIDLASDGAVSLIRDDGVLLARHPSVDYSQAYAYEPDLIRVFPSSSEGPSASAIDGTRRLAGMRAVRPYPMLVRMSVSTDAVLEPWRGQATVIASYALGAATMLGLLIWLFVRQIAQREELASQTAVAKDVAEYNRTLAEEASQAKSHFLARMSHELRTPLNAILGFAQLMQMGRADRLPPDHVRAIEQILIGGEHLLKLVDEVLDLSRIEAGRIQLTFERVPVQQAIRQIEQALAPLARREGLGFAVALPARIPDLFVDRTRLTQILMNLVSNAIKYNRPGGSLAVGAQTVAGDLVRITVSDTGYGIPEERKAELFTPFNRLGAESGPVEGVGIGLSITRHLVERMGGRIGFTSQADWGSKFWVDLPTCLGDSSGVTIDAEAPELADAPHIHVVAAPDPAQDDTPAVAEPVRRHAGEGVVPFVPPRPGPPPDAPRPAEVDGDPLVTVLYVEDNTPNVMLMQGLLRTQPRFHLITAPTAEIGLDIAIEQLPDIIILDINLPGMSGFEALEELKRMPETRDIPAVALSADAMASEIERGIQAGFERYLTKPLNITEFFDVMHNLANRTRPRDRATS